MTEKLKNKSFLLFLLVLMAGCVPKFIVKERYMTLDESVRKIDSLCTTYFMNSDLNLDYLRQHPIAVSKWRIVENRLLTASPVSNRQTNVQELGTFWPKSNLTAEDEKRIQEMQDSISANRKWQQAGIEGTFSLDEDHSICYRIKYDGLDVNDMKVLVSNVGIVDLRTNDTTKVEPKHLWYSLIKNPPLTFATVFDVEHNNETYVVQEIFDIRTRYSRKDSKFRHTRSCFKIE